MANYKYNPEVDKPIFDADGNKLFSIPSSRSKHIYTEDGERLSKITLKIPQEKGFAKGDNAKKINRGGRPKGSKSKNTLNDAIKRFESHQLDAAMIILGMMNGDEALLGGEIKPTDRFNAAKYVIETPSRLKKGTAQAPKSPTLEEEEQAEKEVVRPLISLTVADKS